MLVALADVLDMPLRERNALLLAAGFAPRYSETQLDAPGMAAMQQAITRVLDAHDPYPGVALDRHWEKNIVIANAAARRLVSIVPPDLRALPHNLFRLGPAPARHRGLREQLRRVGPLHAAANCSAWPIGAIDPAVSALLEEVRGYPTCRRCSPRRRKPRRRTRYSCPACSTSPGQRLSLFTTLATFGSPRDVTLAELTVELF